YNGWDTETTARERIEEMTGPQVRQFINVLCVGHSLDAPWEGNGKKDELLIRAKAVGIDVAKLKREAVKKFPTKKQTAKKKGAKVAKKAS
ncbi:MAG: hypothetical protein GY906_35470, partial [bacterium]|nr:hypothetical protein [bacterium]